MEYVTKRKVVWDLCSGLGGWTEAFAQSDWFVVRIEIEKDLEYVPFTRIHDVTTWMDWIDDLPHPDLIVASPPCTEYSLANWRINRETHEPDMDVVRACLDIIDYIKPSWWVLENVKGACKYFIPIMGHHRQAVGTRGNPQFYLWGNFPLLGMKPGWNPSKTDVRDPQLRALIPFELSFQLKRAIEQQTMITRWC
jgi:hypothetical protein